MEQGFEAFQVAMLIKEIHSSLMRDLDCSLLDSGLTPQQIMVIKLIAHKGKITISELCDEMSLSKGTVSGIVSRLEAAGHVRKFKEVRDKRATYVAFSEQGEAFAREYRDLMNDSFKSVFRNFSREELLSAKKELLALKEKLKGGPKDE